MLSRPSYGGPEPCAPDPRSQDTREGFPLAWLFRIRASVMGTWSRYHLRSVRPVPALEGSAKVVDRLSCPRSSYRLSVGALGF